MEKKTKWSLAAFGAIILIFSGKIHITEVISPVGNSSIRTNGLTIHVSPTYADAESRTPIYDYDALPGLHFQISAASPSNDYARMEVADVCVTGTGKTRCVINQPLTDYPENMRFKENTWRYSGLPKEYGAYCFYWPEGPSDPFNSLGNKARINLKAKVKVFSKNNEVVVTQPIESDFILERKFFYVPWWVIVLMPRF